MKDTRLSDMRGRTTTAVLPCETCGAWTRHWFREIRERQDHQTPVYTCEVCQTRRVWGYENLGLERRGRERGYPGRCRCGAEDWAVADVRVYPLTGKHVVMRCAACGRCRVVRPGPIWGPE